jgi:hypothetical protein
MNSSESTEMSTGAQFNISTRRVQQHSTQLKRKINKQIHFDRSIDSEWKENQIPKKNRSPAAQSMSIFTNALALSMMTLSLFNRPARAT